MSGEDGDADDERDVCEQQDAGDRRQRNRHDRASTCTPIASAFPLKKSLKASTHQTHSAGRPATPPSPYQSPPRAAFAARVTQHQATRAGRARERGRRANCAQASPPPLLCGSVTPTQSSCAVGDGGGHAYDTQMRRGRWTAHGASQVR